MESVGETLRRERLRQNLDLQQVARETKINQKLLEAIESDDYSKLPGGVFARSFVRQYARLLGLDEEELAADVQRYLQPAVPEQPQATAPAPAPEPQIVLPNLGSWEGIARPRSSSPLPALAMVVVVMLVCSGIYAWWQRSKQPAPLRTAQQEMPAPQPSPPPPPAAQQPVRPAVQTAQMPAAPPAVSPAMQSAERQMPEVPGGVNLSFTAGEDTWISARSADGKLLFSGILKPNERKDLSSAGDIRVTVGNAGGVAATLNGKPVPAFGPKGQVRLLQFSPGGFQIVPRKPPAVTDPDAL